MKAYLHAWVHPVTASQCGLSGAQMWKEEQEGIAWANHTRFKEAKATGAKTLAVGCPFCMTMLNDASNAGGGR